MVSVSFPGACIGSNSTLIRLFTLLNAAIITHCINICLAIWLCLKRPSVKPNRKTLPHITRGSGFWCWSNEESLLFPYGLKDLIITILCFMVGVANTKKVWVFELLLGWNYTGYHYCSCPGCRGSCGPHNKNTAKPYMVCVFQKVNVSN